MRSVPQDTDSPTGGDRTAKARIRDAAIECFAKHGIAGTTARKVATAAGVSPGLVIHHFGSMEGLRAACDQFVTEVIRQQKSAALSAGPNLDVLAALRDSNTGHLAEYLAKILMDDSPAVEQLVDDLVADAEDYFRQGVEAGTIRPSPNPRGRAALVALWQLGALVLHKHMYRLLGVDLTDPEATTSPAIINYVGPVYEVLGTGFFTEEFSERLQEVLDAMTEDRSTDSAPPPDSPGDGQPTTEGST